MATPTSSFSAPKLTSDIVALTPYLAKPQVVSKFVKTFGAQYSYGLDLMAQLGMFKSLVGGDSWSWQEDDFVRATPAIGVLPTVSGANLLVTLSAASHTDAGTKSYGKPGQNIEFANYLGGRIVSKDTTTPSAHVYTVEPIGYNSAGTALTSTQLLVGLAVGQTMSITSNSFANGSLGQTESTIPTVSQFSNTLQTLTEDFTVNFNEKHNDTWVKFPFAVEGADGQTDSAKYYLKSLYGTERIFQQQIVGAVFGGKGGVSPSGVPQTLGLYPAMEKYSQGLQWSGNSVSLEFFNLIEQIAIKNYSLDNSAYFDVYNGFLATQALQGLKRDYKVGRPDGDAMGIDSRIEYVKMGSITYKFIDMAILNDPATFGGIGDKYKTSMMFVPNGNVTLKDGSEASYFGVRYKPRTSSLGTWGESFVGYKRTGFDQPDTQTNADITNWHMKATVGAEWHALRQMILSSKG